ncbi:MAG: PilZ domain-containing protein [Halobacteria archaeon]|nr:PilZ domain-containing protein [Halobacteria archaeon]
MVVGNHSVFIDLELDTDTQERRDCVRIAVKARICLSHSTFGVINSQSRDISDSGVFVELKNKPQLPVGAHVKMQMLDSVMPEIVFNVKMERSDEDGIGLSFVDYELNGQRYPIDSLKQTSAKAARKSS